MGSPISYSSLARDLELSPHTVKKWVGILESLYVIFIVPPYSKNIARSLLKESKIYFYDVGRIKNDLALRIENIIALSLLKKIHHGQDLRGDKSQLYYVRDREKREVDFLTVIDGKVHDLVEVKLSENNLSPNLSYFSERLKPAFPVQVVFNLNKDLNIKGIPVVKAVNWLEKQG